MQSTDSSCCRVTGLQNYIDVDLVAACATNTPCDTNCKLVVILGAIFYLLIGLQWAWKQHVSNNPDSFQALLMF